MDNCSTIEITRIMEEVNNLTPDSVEPEAVVALTGRLTNITTMERAIFPSDLQNTLTTLETFLRFETFVIENHTKTAKL